MTSSRTSAPEGFSALATAARRGCLALLLGLALTGGALPAGAAGICFASSKTYQIHPLHGGPDLKDGWAVTGAAFDQCVHRAEAADKTLHARYPDSSYGLSLAATIGCHSPC